MSAYRKVVVITLVILILVAGCGSPAATIAPQASPQITSSPEATTEIEFGKPFSDAADYIEGARMFDALEALKHIEYLASDALEGRLVGTPGNLKAGDYIAARFAAYGLLPAGEDNGYFQPFTTALVTNTIQPVLSVDHPATNGSSPSLNSRTYVTHDDYMPRSGQFLGTGDITAPVIVLPYCNPSDLKPDYDGKIILCNIKSGYAPILFIDRMLEYKHTGLLLIFKEGPYERSGNGNGSLIDMPIFLIRPAVAGDILAGSGYSIDTLETMEASLPLQTTVHMASSYEFGTAVARNVLGLLPGSDPTLKDEIVIISAHYDHVGADPDGTIFNGANDNASGVAVMLEVARLWQAQGYRPARSVLFAAWDAEEEGYIGSMTFATGADNLLVQKTVAMLNLEMAGIGKTVFVGGEGAFTDQLKASAAALGLILDTDLGGCSDDIIFQDKGIPSGCVSIDPESYNELLLHRPEDDPGMIDPESLKLVGSVVAHALAAWCGGGLIHIGQ